jgi:hypothetical protein
MKRTILFICLCVLLFAGCHTPKKLVSSTTENIKTSDKQNEVSTNESYSFVDTTKKQGLEINYYKIEFYQPEGPNEPDDIPVNAVLQEGVNNIAGSIPTNKPPNAGKGAIKSIEGYTIKSGSEQTGVNEEKSNTTTNKDAENNTDITNTKEIIEQSASDPYRWRYILGIIISLICVGIVAYFALQKSKIITTIIAFLKKIF